jgi:hypothetical protein
LPYASRIWPSRQLPYASRIWPQDHLMDVWVTQINMIKWTCQYKMNLSISQSGIFVDKHRFKVVIVCYFDPTDKLPDHVPDLPLVFRNANTFCTEVELYIIH